MARDADVFITHLAAPQLAKYHLTDADVHALAPSAIYATLADDGTEDPALRDAFSTIVHRTGGAIAIISAPLHRRDAGSVNGLAPNAFWDRPHTCGPAHR